MSAEPIGFLIRAPEPDGLPPVTLFIRNRPDAETVLIFRRGPKYPPGAVMRPLYWGDGDFCLTEPHGGENA